MRAVFIICSLALIASCSSTSVNNESKMKIDNIAISKIENSDFNIDKEVPFKESEDYFAGESNNFDSLAKESIARFPNFKLKMIAEYKDVISSAVGLCYSNNFDEAFSKLDDAYQKYKRHPSYWNQVGTCYFLKGDAKKAKLFYNKSRGVSKKYTPALNNLGVIYQREGRYEKALYAFEQAAKSSAFSLTPKFNLGQLYLKFGIYSKAKRVFKAIIKKHSTDIDVLNGLATSYLLEGKYDIAVDYFSRINVDFLSNPYYGLNYSLALFKLGKKNDALDLFENISVGEDLNDEIYKYHSKIGKTIKGL